MGANAYMAEQFRVESNAFKTIPWQTDILFTSQGLDQLNDIPELRVSPSTVFPHISSELRRVEALLGFNTGKRTCYVGYKCLHE